MSPSSSVASPRSRAPGAAVSQLSIGGVSGRPPCTSAAAQMALESAAMACRRAQRCPGPVQPRCATSSAPGCGMGPRWPGCELLRRGHHRQRDRRQRHVTGDRHPRGCGRRRLPPRGTPPAGSECNADTTGDLAALCVAARVKNAMAVTYSNSNGSYGASPASSSSASTPASLYLLAQHHSHTCRATRAASAAIRQPSRARPATRSRFGGRVGADLQLHRLQQCVRWEGRGLRCPKPRRPFQDKPLRAARIGGPQLTKDAALEALEAVLLERTNTRGQR